MKNFIYEAPQVEEIKFAIEQVIATSSQEQGGTLEGIPGEDW